MMRLDVLGTGSSGNVYALHAGGETLLLDAGLPTRKIVAGIEDFSRIVGCLVTHEHQDHALAAEELMLRGVPVWMSHGTLDALGCRGVPRIARAGAPLQIGGFTVLPFAAEHDAAEPLGFLIQYDRTGEKLVYATDTYYLRNTFPGIHYWLIECNYVDEIALDQMREGKLPLELRGRLKKSHMSLKRLLELFAANDLTEARKIILCHLSDQRSDEARMVTEVWWATGVNTDAADAGKSFELALCPF